MNKTVGSPVLCVARQMAWVLFACDTPKTLELKTCHVCLSSLGMATSSRDPPPLSTQAHMPKTWTFIFTLYTPKVKGLWMMPSAAIKAALRFFLFLCFMFQSNSFIHCHLCVRRWRDYNPWPAQSHERSTNKTRKEMISWALHACRGASMVATHNTTGTEPISMTLPENSHRVETDKRFSYARNCTDTTSPSWKLLTVCLHYAWFLTQVAWFAPLLYTTHCSWTDDIVNIDSIYLNLSLRPVSSLLQGW